MPYRYRVPVLIPAQSETLTDFPVYIDLSTMPAGFWTHLSDPETFYTMGTETGNLEFTDNLNSWADFDEGFLTHAAAPAADDLNLWADAFDGGTFAPPIFSATDSMQNWADSLQLALGHSLSFIDVRNTLADTLFVYQKGDGHVHL
jgi:hypothetical protein